MEWIRDVRQRMQKEDPIDEVLKRFDKPNPS
jgi:hypothetical protein